VGTFVVSPANVQPHAVGGKRGHRGVSVKASFETPEPPLGNRFEVLLTLPGHSEGVRVP